MQDANTLSALQDDDHPIWTRYRDEIRDSIFLMRALESKQWRPVVIALLRTISDESVIAACLRLLTTAIVRFQVIGKGRTGVVEKVFGRICQSLSNGRINIPLDFKEHLAELLTTDEQFRNTFESHEEKKFSRIAYFLAADRAFESSSNTPPHPREIRKILERNRVVNNSVPADHIAAKMLGAFTLSPTATALPRTELSSTPDEIVERTSLMADHAPQIWNAEC